MKATWLRKIIGGLSFTTAMFVFQACYGTPQDFVPDIYIEGVVKSAEGETIPDIHVSTMPVSTDDDSLYLVPQCTMSDREGRFSFYTRLEDTLTVVFRDIDAGKNGQYADKDTTLTGLTGLEEPALFLDITLDAK